MERVDRTAYPQLDLILWDTAVRYLSAKEAFAIYEKRWSYVDKTQLTPREAHLVDGLTKGYGKGLFLAP